MAGFGRLIFESWSNDDFGLIRPVLDRADVPQTADAFVLPPVSTGSTVIEPPAGNPLVLDASAAVQGASFEDIIFERPFGEIFFDVNGDGAADKIAALLDPDYIPPILDLI